MLGGVSFAGFNVIDPTTLYEEFGKPVIVISRTKPDNKAVKRALQCHFEDWQIRWAVFEKLGSIHTVLVLVGEPPVYVETVGAPIKWAVQLIRTLGLQQNSGTNSNCTVNCTRLILTKWNDCGL